MTALILVLIAVVLLVGAGAAALAIRAKRDYDAGNEVVPGVPTKAPTSWGGAHTPEALLHRRLRTAVLAARAAATAGLGDARATIEQTALAIDERLVAAAALPQGHREPAVASITAAVESLEHAVASMSAVPADSSAPTALDTAVQEVQIRLDALAQARAEVEQIDQVPRPTTDP